MDNRFAKALWRIYNRPANPTPFAYGGNLPYNDPAFSERMLQLHLAEDDAAASRVSAERAQQLNWLTKKLPLTPTSHLLDVACGPGLYAIPLAEQGMRVTGIDFAPAAIAHAKQLAQTHDVNEQCDFVEHDMLTYHYANERFDAALLLYGQLAVMPTSDARSLLHKLYNALKTDGSLCLEMLHPAKVDRKNSTWWFTDESGLWGDGAYLHLGERLWNEAEQCSTERYHIVQLDSGDLNEVVLCDQVYEIEQMEGMLLAAGFAAVEVYVAWDGLDLYDADEWVVFIGRK